MRVSWVVAWLVALSACGGRTLEGRPVPDESGGNGGSGATARAGSGAGARMGGAGTSLTGGASVGGMAVIDEPLEIGRLDEPPPFELPLWLTTTWQEYKTTPFYEVCIAGWGAEQVLAVVAEYDPSLSGTEHHELFDVEPTFNNLRAQTSKSASLGKRAFLFELDTGQTAVAIVFDDEGNGFNVRYLLVEQDCSVRAIGYYAESGDLADCSARVGSPLWSIPPVPAFATCPSTSGFYGFEAKVTQDYCRRSAESFAGVFNYRQTSPTQAELHFVEFPLPKLLSRTYLLSVTGKRASADEGEDNGSCPEPIHTSILLEESSIYVQDEQGFCQGDQLESCSWVMSGPVYGPLN